MPTQRKSQRQQKPSAKAILNKSQPQITLDPMDLDAEEVIRLRALIREEIRQGIKEGISGLKEEISKLKEEVSDLKGRIETLEGRAAAVVSAVATSPQQSYASVASKPSTQPGISQNSSSQQITPSQSASNRVQSTATSPQSTPQSIRKTPVQPPKLDLDLSTTTLSIENKKELQDLMNKCLLAQENLKHVQCYGVAARKQERVSFFFDNPEHVKLIQSHCPWTTVEQSNFNKARMITFGRFKIKLTGIDKQKLGVIEEGQKINDAFIQSVNEAGCISLQSARLLNPHSTGPSAQLVAICSTAEEMEKLLAIGFLPTGDGNVAYVGPFFESRFKTCKLCGGFDHLARICPNKLKCLNCTETHPEQETCSKPSRCFNCQSDHMTTDRICPVRQRRTQRINE